MSTAGSSLVNAANEKSNNNNCYNIIIIKVSYLVSIKVSYYRKKPKVKINLLGQQSPSGEFSTTVCAVNYLIHSVKLLKYPNWKHLFSVDHNQLRSMVSDQEDPID